MAHSKMTKRGRSQYVEVWNPAAKKFIVACALCGTQGYKPSIDEEGFIRDGGRVNYEHSAIHAALTRTLKPLALDETGVCEDCKRAANK